MLYFASEAAALAADAQEVTYNKQMSSEVMSNVAGVMYLLLVAWFLYRVLRRRAKRAKEQKLAGQVSQEEWDNSWFSKLRETLAPAPKPEEAREATAFDALLGAAQAAGLGLGLFLITTKMTAYFGSSPLPDGYTARNVSVTVRTMIEGLSWLATFVFILNAVGLSALSVQMLLFPDKLKQDEERLAAIRRMRSEPQLPKVPITASKEELSRAFAVAEKMGKKDAASQVAAMSSKDE